LERQELVFAYDEILGASVCIFDVFEVEVDNGKVYHEYEPV
jgi:hypothetical protein